MQEVNLAVKKRIGGIKTKLLMHLNGDIIDAAGNIVTQSDGVSFVDDQKFGQKGATFTRTGFIQINKNPNLVFDGDFTFEFFVKLNPTTANGQEIMMLSCNPGMFFDFLGGFAGWNGGRPCVLASFSISNDKSKLIIADTPWLDGQAHHFAACRKNGVITVYSDGVAKGTVSSTVPWDGFAQVIGNYATLVAYGLTYGNMQEVRMSNVCRYEGAFTPPVAPFVLD